MVDVNELQGQERHSFPNREEVRSEPVPEQSREDWDRSHNMDERHRGRDLERVDGEEVTEQPERPARRVRRDKSSLRQELERQFDAAREGEPEYEIEEAVEEDSEPEPQQDKSHAPAAWSKAAKAQWNTLSPEIKHQIWKRELDTETGVVALKKQYKDVDKALQPYKENMRQAGISPARAITALFETANRFAEIEHALIPHEQTIKSFGKTPGQAVSQLFDWHNALLRNPIAAFPALVASYKYNAPQLLAHYGYFRGNEATKYIRNLQWQLQNHPQNKQLAQQFQQAVRYIKQLEGALNQTANQLNYKLSLDRYTNWLETVWAAGKPHFNRVRLRMASLLTPNAVTGQAEIPLTPDGQVDLQRAYDEACRLDPDVRSEIRNGKVKVQDDKVSRARRAAVSISPTSPPSSEISRGSNRPRKGVSIKDSIRDAIAELSDR